MMDSLGFTYNGVSSDDLGLINVSMNSGMREEYFLSERTLNTEQIRGRDELYYQDVTRSPLSFSLTFAFEDGWDDDLFEEVLILFDVDYYKEFFFHDNPDRIYYCQPQGQPRLTHNSDKAGYIEIDMVCNSPYCYSPYYGGENSNVYDCGTVIPKVVDNFSNGTFHGNGFATINNRLTMRQLTWEKLRDRTWGEILG